MSKLTLKKRTEFLSVLMEGASVTAAARAIGVTRQAMYKARANDPDLAAAWDDAIEEGTDALEDEALRRARTSSDTLLIFLLKARRPDLYRERTELQHTGQVNHAHAHTAIDWSVVPDDAIRAFVEHGRSLRPVAALPGGDGTR